MTLPTNPKKAQKPWLDVAIFALVVGFLGFSVQMLLGFARRGEVKVSTAAVKETLPLDGASARKPASPSVSPAVVRDIGVSTAVLRLPCLGQAKGGKLSSDARQLQIHAPACDNDLKQPRAWKGLNESSGEEILVFVNPKEKTFSTSYFALQAGVNKLVFTHERRVETIEVERR